MRIGNTEMRRQRGFTYLWLLFAVAGMGLLLAAASQSWETVARREKEAELLFVGDQFARAIAAYHERSPGAAKQYPAKLEDLVEDTRFPVPQRHLRKIFRDPVSNGTEWGLVKAGGRIVGVHSLSAGKPYRTAFSGRHAAFAGAARYDQWVFGPEIAEAAPAAVQPAAAPGTGDVAPSAGQPAAPETAVPPSESHPCDAAYLGELRLCQAGAAGQAAAQLHRCNTAAAARYAACRRGG